MRIYATLWRLQFPRFGDDHWACEWVEVLAQGVPGHIGTPTPGHGYENGDPFADFLPPPVVLALDDRGDRLRAVVIVRAGTPKDGQRYAHVRSPSLHYHLSSGETAYNLLELTVTGRAV